MNRFNPLRGRRTGIAPAAMQAHLDSASNAGVKGQAQFHTPAIWGEVLATPLPGYRNTIVDLTCGAGTLLSGVAQVSPSASHLLGCDIEPGLKGSELPWSANIEANRVVADVTKFYPLLRAMDWRADLFVLNPPWDLHWYREDPSLVGTGEGGRRPGEGCDGRLSALADSDCGAVRAAFAAHDGRTAKGTIDSTITTLCLALDRCSPYGEGLLIANEATLQRLLFAPEAPHGALAAHVWAHLSVEGNICTPPSPPRPGRGAGGEVSKFQTGILYFARGHTCGVMAEHHCTTIDEARAACAMLSKRRMELREGASAKPYQHAQDTAADWEAAALEWRSRTGSAQQGENPWNLWIDPDGCIRTNLSVFDERAVAVKKAEAAQLHSLNGRHPMQLVLQKADRKALERAAFGTVWRVAPAVREAVEQALKEYNAVRAPLYPLNKIQRLGYLDDNDDILCIKELHGQCGSHFAAGSRYPVKTETLRTNRSGTKMNLVGSLDEVEYEGSELAIYVAGSLFMDERLRNDKVRLSIQDEKAPSPIDYNLQQLAEHFEIPEVPDVSIMNPEGYQRNLDLLAEIEQIVNA